MEPTNEQPRTKAISDEQIDQLGRLADQLDNLIGAMDLPMPATFHVGQLKQTLPEIAAAIKQLVVDVSGENPWEGAPTQ